ncbi:MAG: hypothetical protein ICV79_29180 [Flavisolibacter sp.]|nr:hypothetical protein [Flavisolibacter sp.]
MLRFRRKKSFSALLKKINDLCDLLRKGKREYEQMAASLPDKEIRQTILTLAQERNQYACELSAQLKIFGVKEAVERPQEQKVAFKYFRNLSAVLLFCRLRERKTLRAYRKLLKQSSINQGIQRMIHYQLEGMKCAFIQIKLLSSLKFS